MGALNGIKVLDFTTLLPGPYATMTLADLGAEVLKVSSKGKYDLVTHWPPVIDGTDTTGAAAWLGRNKKTIHLNMKKPAAVEAVKKLVMEYDIVVEQFRPGVMSKLGIGYDELKAINPKIIYCAITGYGQTGPMALRAGHDINYMSRSGIISAAGRKETGPALFNFQIADVVAGSKDAIIGILAAIRHRDQTGEGQFVDVSMEDGVIPFNSMDGASFFAGADESKRAVGLLNGGGIYDFYETKDGHFMGVGSLEPKFFADLCKGTGHPDWADGKILKTDPETAKKTFIDDFKSKTKDEWVEIFSKLDACVEPVFTLDEAAKDEHHAARGMFPDVPLPQAQGKTVKQLGCPIKLSASPVEYKHAGYPEGWDTDEILSGLGYSADEIADMSED